MKRLFEYLQRRIFATNHAYDYVALVLLALLPIAIAHSIGIAHSKSIKLDGKSYSCSGYVDRRNWLTLVVLLPAALFVVRFVTDLLFCGTWRWPKTKRISDFIPGDSAKALEQFKSVYTDSRNFAWAFGIDVLVHVVDMWGPVLSFYYRSFRGEVGIMPPERWDWSLWYLSAQDNHRLLYANLGLVTTAYLCQFLLGLFAFGLVVLLFRHNLFYLKSIYMRSRAKENPSRQMIPLDFNSDDSRFGLGELFPVFTVEILVLAVAGAFTLISRFSNSTLEPIRQELQKALDSGEVKLSLFWKLLGTHSSDLFLTLGQVLLLGSWILLFSIVLMPALLKLLPMPELFRTNSMNLRQFLLEFLPHDSLTATSTNDLSKKEDQDKEAEKFSEQAFWPAGDGWAKLFSIAAFLVFFFMLIPVFSIHLSWGLVVFYAVVCVLSYVASEGLFLIFKYLLRAVSPKLVEKAKKD